MAFKVTRVGLFIAAAYLLGLLFFIQDDGVAIAGAVLLSAALIADRLIRDGINLRVFALLTIGYLVGLALLFFDLDYPQVAFRGPVLIAGCLFCDVLGMRLEQRELAEYKLKARLDRLELDPSPQE